MPPTQRETLAWFGMILGALQQPCSENFRRLKPAPHFHLFNRRKSCCARGSRRRLYTIHWPRARQPARTGAWPGGGWQA